MQKSMILTRPLVVLGKYTKQNIFKDACKLIHIQYELILFIDNCLSNIFRIPIFFLEIDNRNLINVPIFSELVSFQVNVGKESSLKRQQNAEKECKIIIPIPKLSPLHFVISVHKCKFLAIEP